MYGHVQVKDVWYILTRKIGESVGYWKGKKWDSLSFWRVLYADWWKITSENQKTKLRLI